MSTPQTIVDLIDAGLASGNGGIAAPVDQAQCGRQGCKQPAVDGHSFCQPCLAWLRFEVDDDPLEANAKPAADLEPEDEYHAWVAAMCGYA